MARYSSVVDDLKSLSSDEAVSEPDEFLSCENGQDEKSEFSLNFRSGKVVDWPVGDSESVEFESLNDFDLIDTE